MTITAKTTFDLTKVYIGEVCHLAFVRGELIGFQSWKTYHGHYFVELTFKSGATILAEYDSPDKWKTVISIVEENLTT